MKFHSILLALLTVCTLTLDPAKAVEEQTAAPEPEFTKPLYKPFIERYVLDELKQLRIGQQELEVRVTEKVAGAKLEASDRAIRYTADTTNNIFYIITAAATMLVLFGWKSVRDVRASMEDITTKKISELVEEYEKRLAEIEKKMRKRSEQILTNQEQIALTNNIHSLWMRAGLEKSEQEKINIYDQILELRPDDVEVLTYKADALLEIGEKKWALSLANQALEHDNEYSLAYWQRACAKSEIGFVDEAVEDLETAIDLSDTLKEEVAEEKSFKNLAGNKKFEQILNSAG
ncbi:tetratricopeptide repeat protein [Desulfogranum marinum]|uniref:tetratricopeptide repeat protein n=1 Tax=Desulfogranum marinum TaxID=453220 RepID=UPI001963E8BB|nr:hypothetical protein [Desulfogranum marinum]MBM9513042.1 hypothetical protein [Desulfogranum marinum]